MWTLNSSPEEHCKGMIVAGVGTRAELQASYLPVIFRKPDENESLGVEAQSESQLEFSVCPGAQRNYYDRTTLGTM